MTIKVRTASGSMGIKSIRVNDGVSTRRAVKIKVRTGVAPGAINQVYLGILPIVIGFSPNPIDETSFSGSTVSATATALITEGLAPFTYTWSVFSFTGPTSPTISNTAIANPTFTQTGVPLFGSRTAVFRVVVNDAAGQTATADLSATFRQENFS